MDKITNNNNFDKISPIILIFVSVIAIFGPIINEIAKHQWENRNLDLPKVSLDIGSSNSVQIRIYNPEQPYYSLALCHLSLIPLTNLLNTNIDSIISISSNLIFNKNINRWTCQLDEIFPGESKYFKIYLKMSIPIDSIKLDAELYNNAKYLTKIKLHNYSKNANGPIFFPNELYYLFNLMFLVISFFLHRKLKNKSRSVEELLERIKKNEDDFKRIQG